MNVNTYPFRYSPPLQTYKEYSPYPMNFMQAPSFNNQVLVDYGGQTALQGLSTVRGPFMFPVRKEIIYPVEKVEQIGTGYSFLKERPAFPIVSQIQPSTENIIINSVSNNQNNQIAYPLTHSVPGPYQQTYIQLANPADSLGGGRPYPAVKPEVVYSFYTRK